MCETFEKQTASRLHCDHLPYPAFGKDFQSIIQVLLDEDVFNTVHERQHATFKFRQGLMETLSLSQLVAKIEPTLSQTWFVRYH